VHTLHIIIFQDPYFPRGMVDLRYAISCDPYQEKDIRLRTNTKTIHLCADSVPSRAEWVKAIRRVIFKTQNMGDSVKVLSPVSVNSSRLTQLVQIAIPYSTIIDVDKSTALDFRETIEVKVVDGIEDLAVDSYFFTYFHDISAALEQIRDAIARTRPFVPEAQESPSSEQLIDTTVSRSNSTSRTGTSEHIQTYPEVTPRSSSSFRLSALLRPFQEIPLGRAVTSPGQQDEHEEFTHVEKRDNSSFVPIALPPPPSDISSTNQANEFLQSHTTRKPLTIPSSHTYPPFTSPGESLAQTTQEQSLATSWVSVPSWLRMSRRSLGGSSGASNQQSAEAKAVTEVYSSGTHQSIASSQGAELGYSVLETPDSAIDPEMIEKFQALFAFDDKEKLFGCLCSST
jgi:sterol 3beta-glucosyltransferase